MSNITKKIFSIEPMDAHQDVSEPSAKDIVRPINEAPLPVKKTLKEPTFEKVPDFVTREAVTPRTTPPNYDQFETDDIKSGWVMWTIVGLSCLYLIGAGLYFGLPLLEGTPNLFAISGLIVLLILPILLLVLLGIALRQLTRISSQNRNLARAADILLSPETEALARSQTLANGIQREISTLNTHFADTLDVMKGVQTAVSLESQSLDAAGVQLSSRAEDVGRNLTLQRQALESISGTFDARMGTLSAQISETSQELEAVCVEAESKLSSAGKTLTETTELSVKNIGIGTEQIHQQISELGEISRKLDDNSTALNSDLGTSTQELTDVDAKLEARVTSFTRINEDTQAQITRLQETIGHGHQMLSELQDASYARETELNTLYERLSQQLQKSENDTLASQGQTARIVETNLAQMRRDFAGMETELQTLQVKLNNLRDSAEDIPQPEIKTARLNLKPLESDFPPVEPPRSVLRPRHTPDLEIPTDLDPLNLGMEMEIETPDQAIVDFKPDVIMRPGQPVGTNKGFGRRNEKESSGWRWRDMLGSLEKPDADPNLSTTSSALPDFEAVSSSPTQPIQKVDITSRLSGVQLSPSAFVDEGIVVDATQARMDVGETGLIKVVQSQLPDAVKHLKDCMAMDPQLASDVRAFHADFSTTMGNTPPSAPALRAALGSPNGQAYLLCTAALAA